MSQTSDKKSLPAKVLLNCIPPIIREDLLLNSNFCSEYGLQTDASISLGPDGVSMRRSELFDAIRSMLADSSELLVKDISGKEWTLKNASNDSDEPCLVLSNGEIRLLLPDFSLLAQNPKLRLQVFEVRASEVNLPKPTQEHWLEILTNRALEDKEFTELQMELCDKSVHVAQLIRQEAEVGKASIDSLIPHSRAYYESLVGVYDDSLSIEKYAAGPARKLITQLMAWSSYEGFLLSLFLSAHSALPNEIDINDLRKEDLVSAYAFLENHGDRLSQLGAIEVGLQVLPEHPELEPFIIRIIEQIRDEDTDSSFEGFRLLSALFVLVDGTLSESRMFISEPPFYRRLVSFAQAALIHRQLIGTGIGEEFISWALSACPGQYFIQTHVDMRLEPRWDPEMIEPKQLRVEFLGRIINAARTHENSIRNAELLELILGNKENSILSVSEYNYSMFFPGPLEGASLPLMPLPANYQKAIDSQLQPDEAKKLSFAGLINSAKLFSIDANHIELAVQAIQRNNYHLPHIENSSQRLSVLIGLAEIAAVYRNSQLANLLRILVRVYRGGGQDKLSINEAIRIGLLASASHEDAGSWQVFIGEWITELAFSELDKTEGLQFHSQLKYLLHLVPELWVSCAKADAALQAHNASL